MHIVESGRNGRDHTSMDIASRETGTIDTVGYYIRPLHVKSHMISIEFKRGTAELAVLSVLEEEPLHGYEIGRRIDCLLDSVPYDYEFTQHG